MNAQIELNLALVLFLPWFSILAILFWAYPRAPRSPARTLFDTASLSIALIAAVAGMHWSMANADPQFGPMWKQVLATSVAYGLFLLAMTVAVLIRHRWLTRSSTQASSP